MSTDVQALGIVVNASSLNNVQKENLVTAAGAWMISRIDRSRLITSGDPC